MLRMLLLFLTPSPPSLPRKSLTSSLSEKSNNSAAAEATAAAAAAAAASALMVMCTQSLCSQGTAPLCPWEERIEIMERERLEKCVIVESLPRGGAEGAKAGGFKRANVSNLKAHQKSPDRVAHRK